MKYIAVAMTWLAINFAVASQPVTVTGTGISKKAARENAVVNAIETYCGTAVISDKTFKNRSMVTNDVTTSSSCFVKNSKILISERYNGGYQVLLELTLEHLPISEKIISENNQLSTPDNYNWENQVNSYDSYTKDRDKFIKQVLNDFPYNAFEIRQHNTFISFENRDKFLTVPYTIQWNQNYITALHSTLKLIGSSKTKNGYPIKISYNNSFKDKNYYLYDYNHFNILQNKMTGNNEPYIELKITFTNGKLLKSCAPVQTKNNIQIGDYYHYSVSNHATINTQQSNKKAFYLNIEKFNIPLDKIDTVELKIVSYSDCNIK